MFAANLASHWAGVRAALAGLLGRFEAADLDFRPYPAAWTVRELMLHIAHEEYGEVQHGITRSLTAWPDPFPLEDYPSLAQVKLKLEAVHVGTVEFLASVHDSALAREVETPWGAKDTLAALLGHVIEHEVHHRAELSLILGILGRPGLDA